MRGGSRAGQPKPPSRGKARQVKPSKAKQSKAKPSKSERIVNPRQREREREMYHIYTVGVAAVAALPPNNQPNLPG